MKSVDRVLLALGYPVALHDYDVSLLSQAADGYDDPYLLSSEIGVAMQDDVEAMLDDSHNPEKNVLAWELQEYICEIHHPGYAGHFLDAIGAADLCRLLPCRFSCYRDKVAEVVEATREWSSWIQEEQPGSPP